MNGRGEIQLAPQRWHPNAPLGCLFEPAEEAWCTNWHRDWRDNYFAAREQRGAPGRGRGRHHAPPRSGLQLHTELPMHERQSVAGGR